MKVLMLTRYARLGASSRMRFVQYLPQLMDAGVSISSAPLFSDEYVRGLQHGMRNPVHVLKAYGRRIKALVDSRNFDLVWIEKEALPWLPAWLEKTLLCKRVPYVLDYDDAVFHYYDQHSNRFIRAFLSGKHPELIRGARLIVAGNEYLANFAKNSGAQCVQVLPTVVDLARYPDAAKPSSNADDMPTIGWIGQRATASFLTPLVPLFKRLSAECLAKFMAVGIDAKALGLPMDSVAWSEDTEVESIHQLDIGIMPLIDGAFERGKCGYKLIQYMACGLPVVASPVGVNREIVEHGVNGYLVETPAQWEQALRTLLVDSELRQRMGRAGRLKVEQQYSLQVTGPRLVELLIAATRK